MKYLIFLLLLLFVACVTDSEYTPTCVKTYDYCRKMNYDGTETCGYPSMQSCMNHVSAWGFICTEYETETCH